MSSRSDNVELQVIHYQKKIERYAADNRIDSLLYCIHKLKYLPVTVAHLEGTGIGKSVNMLRNCEGVIGFKARALVAKWKEMVSVEEAEELQETEEMEVNQNEGLSNTQVEPTTYSNLAENVIPDNDTELPSNMTKEYDSNGNDLTIEESEQNCYNPHTSQQDYMSAGPSRQAGYNPATELDAAEYVPSGALYNNSPSQNIGYSPTESLPIDDKVINGNDKHHTINDDSGSKRHKNKHKSKDQSKHKHKHHSKDKKRSKHSPSKSNHHREKKPHTSTHPSHTSREQKDGHDSQKSHISNSSVDISGRSDAKASTSKRKVEPVNDFESALLGMDNYQPKLKRKKLSKQRKPLESSTSKVASSFDSNHLPRLPSFMTEGSDSSFNLSTSYKPISQIINKQYNSTIQKSNEEEGLNFMFSAKNNRQKIMYTGKSLGRTSVVPSLFNQCIRVLQENIDALEYTGGIPYMILKPVLERANPLQLFNIEDYNPYLLEDTNSLWELHCRRSFKNMKREEMETWRDMFVRCTDENDQKFRNITEKLERKFVTKAAPKRTTQLAEFAGAPGRGFKKMAKAKMIVSSATPTTSSAASSSQPASKPHARPQAVKKPKMGAMMAKSVQLYKKIFRR